jgi:hypothetical protein
VIDDIGEEEAQQIHDLARDTDSQHDQISCWCCCFDCEFDVPKIMANG